MTVTIIDGIRWTTEIFLLCYYVSVVHFIFRMTINKKNKDYQSAFYILFLMISVADITTIIDNFLVIKIILINEWKPWFYVRPLWDTIGWACSGYCIYFQSLLHVGIATNRAWTAFTMNNHTQRTKAAAKYGKWFIAVLPFVALAILAPRFGGHSKYYYDENNELYTVYIEKHVAVYQTIAGPSVVLSTSTITFVLAIATILRYRNLFKSFGNHLPVTQRHDILLFIQAGITFIFQIALAAYYVIRFFAIALSLQELQGFAVTYFDYINDAGSLCNPIALLLICKFIRNDYTEFYGLSKIKSKHWFNNSSVDQQTSVF